MLVVEDDTRMADAIRRGLRYEGLVVDVASDGDEALARVGAIEYEAVVLDVMLPGMDGVEICRRLRERAQWVPVLMLTARDAIEDRVRGLDGGADDYMTKPFSLAELTARLRALARRGQAARPTVLEAAWDAGFEQRSNVVEVYVRYLREKIDRPFGVSSIETVRGAGYRLRRDGGA